MWWWIFSLFVFFFGEVLFFAELLDVYSYYVFATPLLFACLVTSVDEELRCLGFFFFIVVVWWQGNGVTLLMQVHIPTHSLKWRFRGKTKLNGLLSVWQFRLLDGKLAFVSIVGIWWIRDSSSPIFFKGCLFFLILFVVFYNFNVLVILFGQNHFLSVMISFETDHILICTEYLLIAPSNCGALYRLLLHSRLMRCFLL